MLKIGTSGYSFADWKGTIYPKSLSNVNMLYYYENELGFDTVEINFTYYRQPEVKTMSHMVRSTHQDFQFTVKAYKEMTHEIWDEDKNLKDNKEIFKIFLEGIGPLMVNKRLGCILAQFPVMFYHNSQNKEYLLQFKERVGELPLVVEFRNASWVQEDTFEFLKENEMGFCIVDEPKLPRLVPMVEAVTSGIGYFRFHGRNTNWFNAPASERYNYSYSDDELKSFMPMIKNVGAKTKTTYLFFNNCHGGKAAKNAKRLIELLGLTSDKRRERLFEI